MADAVTSVAPVLDRGRTRSRVLHGFVELATQLADTTNAPGWLADLRRAGAARFAEVGLPGPKDEEWRFTPLQGLAAAQFGTQEILPSVSVAGFGQFLLDDGDGWPALAVVDGHVDLRLSRPGVLPPGVTVGSLAHAITAGNPLVERHLAHHVTVGASSFTAVNAALFADGGFIHVPAGVMLSQPVQVVHVATSAAADSILAPRTLVILGRGAEATILESFVSLKSSDNREDTARSYFTDACAEVVLGEGARLEHIRLQREAPEAWHIGFTAVDQERDSHYRSFTLALGARLSRHNLHTRLGAPDVETLLYGLYLARGEQLVDNHTAIFHDHPNGRSWEVYKGVLAERAHGVFNGKVIVQPAAQKTDAKQTNRNLLLGDQAKVDTKPQLEIFADDVKCTHGATVGQLDEQQRYYLRTRGIAGRTAEVLLITAFLAEVIAEINQPQIRQALQVLVHAEMDGLIR